MCTIKNSLLAWPYSNLLISFSLLEIASSPGTVAISRSSGVIGVRRGRGQRANAPSPRIWNWWRHMLLLCKCLNFLARALGSHQVIRSSKFSLKRQKISEVLIFVCRKIVPLVPILFLVTPMSGVKLAGSADCHSLPTENPQIQWATHVIYFNLRWTM